MLKVNYQKVRVTAVTTFARSQFSSGTKIALWGQSVHSVPLTLRLSEIKGSLRPAEQSTAGHMG